MSLKVFGSKSVEFNCAKMSVRYCSTKRCTSDPQLLTSVRRRYFATASTNLSLSQLPRSVRVVEVGPRDGLQNEKTPIDTSTKIELIRRLVGAGLKSIEITSFVSPKWVPQMGDHAELTRFITQHQPGENLQLSVLTPNLKGYEKAIECGAKEVAIFGAASETFSQKNINCSIQESLEKFQPIMDRAPSDGVKVRGYVSCIAGCPYEGPIPEEKVLDVTCRLLDMGCYEVSLGDTIGVATPSKILRILEVLLARLPPELLALHCHDTYGMSIANIFAGLTMGISTFDSSVSGLGGCPYAKGASGNAATEDLLYLLQGLGIFVEGGPVNLEQVVEAGRWISDILGRENGSKVGKAFKCNVSDQNRDKSGNCA